jgi:hypothetical protein
MEASPSTLSSRPKWRDLQFTPTRKTTPRKLPFQQPKPPFQQPSPCSSVNDLLLSQRSLKTAAHRNHHPRKQLAKFNEYWYYKKVVAVVTVELRGRALNSTHPAVASEAAVCSTGEISPYRSPEQAKQVRLNQSRALDRPGTR